MIEALLALAGSVTAAALINKIGDAIRWWAAPYQLVRMAKKEAIAARIRAESDIEIDNMKQRAALRRANKEIAHRANVENIVLKALNQSLDNGSPDGTEND